MLIKNLQQSSVTEGVHRRLCLQRINARKLQHLRFNISFDFTKDILPGFKQTGTTEENSSTSQQGIGKNGHLCKIFYIYRTR